MAEWSATDDETLVRLAGQELSASKIVAAFAELGLEPRTRNAILGRCMRIGVTLTGRKLKKPRPPRFWDLPEPLAMLRELWAAGVTVSEIGAKMSATFGQKISRNAVVGKAHRIGLAFEFPRASHTNVETNRVRLKMAAREKRIKRERIEQAKIERETVILADVSFARPWIERESGQCAFPLGKRYEVMSCCFPTDETYCKAHRQVMGGERKPWSPRDHRNVARAA